MALVVSTGAVELAVGCSVNQVARLEAQHASEVLLITRYSDFRENPTYVHQPSFARVGHGYLTSGAVCLSVLPGALLNHDVSRGFIRRHGLHDHVPLSNRPGLSRTSGGCDGAPAQHRLKLSLTEFSTIFSRARCCAGPLFGRLRRSRSLHGLRELPANVRESTEHVWPQNTQS